MPDRDNTYSTNQIRKISQCHSSYGKKTRLASPKLDRWKDLNKAIKRNKLNFELYVNRGLTKHEIGDIKGACSDWRKASSLGYEEARAWVEEEC